jgi:Uma2 family endonuclease
MSEERLLKERYTYGDYRSWHDELSWELIDGGAFCMSPGPGTAHQSLLTNLIVELGNYFKGKECRVFAAPFDVMLPKGEEAEDEIDTVVQPDIMILCDKSKLERVGIKGAPDVVFEILSPSTARRDLADKLYLYERAGVREYLIVDPDNRVVTAYRRGDKELFSKRAVYRASGTLEFETFPDLKIPLDAVFADWA